MFWVADLGDGIKQGTSLARLEQNLEVDSGSSGWVAQSLPVDGNTMPGMHDLRVVPRNDGCREVGEGHYGEKEEKKEPEVSHEWRKSARNMRIRVLWILRGSGALRTWIGRRVSMVHFTLRTEDRAKRGFR